MVESTHRILRSVLEGVEEATLNVTPKTLRMHLDADRDGVVDDDTTGLDTWEWGAGKKGAVIFCNSDDDDSNRHPDHENRTIDSDADVSDIAPLRIRRNVPDPFPPGWTAILRVSDRRRIRVFDRRVGGRQEVIGPGTPSAEYQIPDLTPQELEYGMEATQHPDRDFDGELELTLLLKNAAGADVQVQRAKVRVAPWLLSNHLDPTEEIFVVRAAAPSNESFLKELTPAVQSGTGLPAPTVAPDRYRSDRWMQDVMEVGFSTLPKSGPRETWNVPVALRSPNSRDSGEYNLGSYPRREFLNQDRGFISAMALRLFRTWDSFGNLECSPSVTMADGTEYKFGRIIHGDKMRARLKRFLRAQKVQKPISIDTDFLRVGHVDEILSFVPYPGSPDPNKKFKLVLASPQVAMSILESVRSAGHGSARMFVGIPAGYGYEPRVVEDFLDSGFWRNVQSHVQSKIDNAENILCTELNLDPATDLIKLPVLFRRATGSARYHVANTADVVNMLVLTKADGTANLIIPKPFGAVVAGNCQFEEYIRPRLEALGNTVFFVDDFVPYHHLLGEIHCGTNSRRKPPIDRWWWEQTAF